VVGEEGEYQGAGYLFVSEGRLELGCVEPHYFSLVLFLHLFIYLFYTG